MDLNWWWCFFAYFSVNFYRFHGLIYTIGTKSQQKSIVITDKATKTQQKAKLFLKIFLPVICSNPLLIKAKPTKAVKIFMDIFRVSSSMLKEP